MNNPQIRRRLQAVEDVHVRAFTTFNHRLELPLVLGVCLFMQMLLSTHASGLGGKLKILAIYAGIPALAALVMFMLWPRIARSPHKLMNNTRKLAYFLVWVVITGSGILREWDTGNTVLFIEFGLFAAAILILWHVAGPARLVAGVLALVALSPLLTWVSYYFGFEVTTAFIHGLQMSPQDFTTSAINLVGATGLFIASVVMMAQKGSSLYAEQAANHQREVNTDDFMTQQSFVAGLRLSFRHAMQWWRQRRAIARQNKPKVVEVGMEEMFGGRPAATPSGRPPRLFEPDEDADEDAAEDFVPSTAVVRV